MYWYIQNLKELLRNVSLCLWFISKRFLVFIFIRLPKYYDIVTMDTYYISTKRRVSYLVNLTLSWWTFIRPQTLNSLLYFFPPPLRPNISLRDVGISLHGLTKVSKLLDLHNGLNIKLYQSLYDVFLFISEYTQKIVN